MENEEYFYVIRLSDGKYLEVDCEYFGADTYIYGMDKIIHASKWEDDESNTEDNVYDCFKEYLNSYNSKDGEYNFLTKAYPEEIIKVYIRTEKIK